MVEIINPTLKMVTKADFDSLRSNYEHVEPSAQSIIDTAEPLDVLVLTVTLGSGLKILSADVIKGKDEKAVLNVFRRGNV
jgi:hypothetical protein